MDRDPQKHDFEEEQSVNLIQGLGPIYLPRMDHCRHCGEHRSAHVKSAPAAETYPPGIYEARCA